MFFTFRSNVLKVSLTQEVVASDESRLKERLKTFLSRMFRPDLDLYQNYEDLVPLKTFSIPLWGLIFILVQLETNIISRSRPLKAPQAGPEAAYSSDWWLLQDPKCRLNSVTHRPNEAVSGAEHTAGTMCCFSGRDSLTVVK